MGLFISLSIIAAHMVLLHIIRKSVRIHLKQGFVQDVVHDGLCAYELGCVAQEQGVILENYGIYTWAFCLFLFVVYQFLFWGGVSASPVGHLQAGLTGQMPAGQVVVRVGVMLLASLASYTHMTTVWDLEASNNHSGRALATRAGVCVLPWGGTPRYQILWSELFGTLVLSILIPKISNNAKLTNNDHKFHYRACLISASIVLVVIAGMDISGGMYNPTLATLLLGGCTGLSWFEHITVYWAGPVMGSCLAPKLTSFTDSWPPEGKKEKTS